MITIAKIGNVLVEVIKVVDQVAFSDEHGWMLICIDFEKIKRRQEQVKWIPASTPVEWIRTFEFKE